MNTQPFQPPFVGKSRILLVDGLVCIYNQVIKSNEPHWVSFEAPSGWGKTRVVQEFYTRIANQQDKQYWPNTIFEALNIEKNNVAARRKRIFPDFKKIKREYGALPDFMWWGIACTERGAVASEVLLEDLEQFNTHKLYLEASWAARASFKEKHFPSLELAKRGFSNAVEEGGATGLAKFIENIADASVFGVGSFVKFMRWGLSSATRSIEKEKQLEYCGALVQSAKSDDLLEVTIADTLRLSLYIPTIIFVEDFHSASPLTIQLIERLVRSNSKILIITTSWPEQLNQHTTIQTLFKDTFLEKRISRVQNSEKLPDVFPANASLDELPQDAMQEIILSYYPEAEAETLEKLARRYNNPLPLELVCSLPQYQRQFPNLMLSSNEIDRLPTTAKGVYQDSWNTLTNEIRQALTLATLGIPDRHSVWHKEMIQNAIYQFEVIENKAVAVGTFETDHLPKSWIRIIDDWAQYFNEPDQLHLVQENTHDHFSENEINQFLKLIAEEISKHKLEDIDPTASHSAWLMLTIHSKRLMDDDTVFSAVLFLQKMLEDFPRELKTRLWLGEYADNLTIDKNSKEVFESRLYHAIALGQSYQYDKAIVQYKSLLTDQQRVLGTDHLDTLRTRNNMALDLHVSGQTNEAFKQFMSLLDDQQRILGADHKETLITRANIINSFLKNSERLGPLKSLLADQQRIFGTENLETLATRSDIVACLANSGQLAEAIVQYKTLLTDQQHILGADHIYTLITRKRTASCLAQSGKINKAIEEFRILLPDLQRIFGAEHPVTLDTCEDIAICLAKSGQLTEAIVQYKTLLTDRQRIIGFDHPDTLRTRNKIASCLEDSDQLAEAIVQYRTLLIEQQRMLGADHPNTLITRGNIAFCLGKSEQVNEAIEQYKTLLTDQRRILGDDHQETLATHNNLAAFLYMSGQLAEAIEQFKILLAYQHCILGADHHDTLRTNYNIASCLEGLGQLAEAIERFKYLLTYQQRILGSDHQETLITKRRLAYLDKE